MNILIIGCGETGSRLAQSLDRLGFDVAIIEENKNKFELLSEDFSGLCVHGSATDVDVLRNAGSSRADIAIVVTNNDNVNIMVARTLDVEFGIKDVYVRLFDPSRESVFRKMGLKTVCATKLECDIFMGLVTDRVDEIESVHISGTSVRFRMGKTDRKDIDKEIFDIRCKDDEMVFALKRKDGTVHLANEPELHIEEGDKIIYAII